MKNIKLDNIHKQQRINIKIDLIRYQFIYSNEEHQAWQHKQQRIKNPKMYEIGEVFQKEYFFLNGESCKKS